MYKITNVSLLGTEYTVSDKNGVVLKTIQIVTPKEILEAALGEYGDKFSSMDDYLTKSVAVLTGFESIKPNKILWYATSDEEVILSDLISFAIQHDYDKIIIEYLEELDK